MEEKHNPNQQDHYQTGYTQPPKSRNGIIALLLILVILLTGLVSFMGAWNIRLSRALQGGDLSSLSEAPDGSTTGTAATTSTAATTGVTTGQPSLGITGQEVSSVSQHYYDIPAGVYITQVSGQAQTRGVRAGDILLDVNGIRITTLGELADALTGFRVGDMANITLYRDHQELQLSLEVEAEA